MVPLNKLRVLLKAGSIAGLDGRLRNSALKVCGLLSERFASTADPEVTLGFVPGRIEIAGKHTDYAGGHTLVCAIRQGFLFVAAANSNGLIRIVEDSSEFAPLEFPFQKNIRPPAGLWANYPMTMAQRVASNFGGEAPLKGVDIAFASDMPVGSGMSGSSALMMMCFCAIARINRLHEKNAFLENISNGLDLATYLACVENGQTFRNLSGGKGVGTFGGSEDHTAILNCSSGAASLYQYAPTVLKAEAIWPSEWAIVLAFSGVRAEKTKKAMEKYNLASRRASLAVSAYNHTYRKELRNLGELEATTRGVPAASWLKGLGDSIREREALDLPGRIRQFLLEERETTPQVINALLWGNLDAFGTAVSASHRASRRLLWNITPEIDFLQKSALTLGAAGASGFGAGFGGSIFAVIQAEREAGFTVSWRQEYAKRYPEREGEAAFFSTAPESGIRLWEECRPSRFVDLLFQA
jgi:galactokinase